LRLVHDCGFGCDGTTGDLSSILKVYHCYLRGLNADDPFIGRHGGKTVLDGRLGYTQSCEL
jgi:hypothetical protein